MMCTYSNWFDNPTVAFMPELPSSTIKVASSAPELPSSTMKVASAPLSTMKVASSAPTSMDVSEKGSPDSKQTERTARPKPKEEEGLPEDEQGPGAEESQGAPRVLKHVVEVHRSLTLAAYHPPVLGSDEFTWRLDPLLFLGFCRVVWWTSGMVGAVEFMVDERPLASMPLLPLLHHDAWFSPPVIHGGWAPPPDLGAEYTFFAAQMLGQVCESNVFLPLVERYPAFWRQLGEIMKTASSTIMVGVAGLIVWGL